MNKAELAAEIANRTNNTKKSVEEMLQALTEVVVETVAKGDRVTLVGFGTFSVSKRDARTGRNPQTGETIKIAAKKVAKFKPGKKLSDAVN